ncbi:MAG TPA: TetR/AcrR family transcriptional regulator [Polyangiaceae bacterium]|nr:TetR/AcrR family transcriptional regulator [Polyangiaceae bacterium]
MARSSASKDAGVKRAIQHYARTTYSEAILLAAERVFLRRGYHEAKMADVAAEAGVAVGTLYKYFDSKEQVFASLSSRGREELFALLQACLSLSDARDRLRAVVHRCFSYAEERGSLFAVYEQLGSMVELHIRSAGGVDAQRACERFVSLLHVLFEEGQEAGVIRRDAPAAMLSTIFAGSMHAVLFSWVRDGRRDSLIGRAEPLLDLFLEGACVR